MADPFRRAYRELTDEEKKQVDDIKTLAGELYQKLETDPAVVTSGDKARALAIAKTNLEQAVMWAVKAVTG